MSWTTDEDRVVLLDPGGCTRVYAVEYVWPEAIRTVELYGYHFDAKDFRPFGFSGIRLRNARPRLTADRAAGSLAESRSASSRNDSR